MKPLTTFTFSFILTLSGLSFNSYSDPCPVNISGTTSLCNYRVDIPWQLDIKITNFDSNNPQYYTVSILPTWAGTASINPLTINSAAIYLDLDPSINNSTTDIEITVTYANPNYCTSTTKYYVYKCCEISGVTNYIDDNMSSFPNQYNPLGYYEITGENATVNGILTVNAWYLLTNCNLYMAPGSQIKVSNSMYIKFASSVVTAACDEMWKGIELDDYASITLVTGSEISDAQYAIKFLKGGFLTITAGGATLKRNYISLYAPYISTNTPPNNTRNISIPFFEQAIFDGSSNTINEYMGQTPSVVNNKSLAGIVLNDVNNFSIPFVSNPLLGNQFNDLNSGIALFRSKSTIHSCNFNDIHKINGYSFPYSGNAIYCNSDKNNICSIQIGALQNNLIDNTFTKCDKGVVCSNNINMVVEGNHFNEVSEEAILSVANPLMNIQITNNKIEKVNMGTKVLSSPNALLNISNNTISSIHPYYSGNFGSTGIIVMNKSTNAMRGSISSNIIGLSRIGIYLSLLDKDATAPKLNITNNNLYFHLPPTQIGSDVHYAIWSDGCNNLNISDNSLDRMYPISLGLSQAMYGLYIRQGKNIDLTRNSISRFGTAMRFQDNCSNTKLQCNNMIACEQGVFLNDATTILTTQGNPSTMEAWDNKWTAFGLNNNRTACSIVNPPIGVIWYH